MSEYNLTNEWLSLPVGLGSRRLLGWPNLSSVCVYQSKSSEANQSGVSPRERKVMISGQTHFANSRNVVPMYPIHN